MNSYGQYCPISRAADVLGDRWTILIVRDLLTGSIRFNELIRGNPGLSRSLLSRRLDQLSRSGIVDRQPDGTYRLTAAGEELRPVVFGFAAWGARWAFGEPQDEELDPDLLIWWLHRRLDTAHMPGRRSTIFVRFSDHPKRYWIVVEDEASVCVADPGFDVDVTVVSDRSTLFQVYLGRTPLAGAVRAGGVEVSGSRPAVRGLMAAFTASPVAELVAAGAAADRG